MAYTIPNFNLTVDVFRYSGAAYSNIGSIVGNLQMGRRTPFTFLGGGPGDYQSLSPYLLCPAGTDLRDLECGTALNDVVEVPQGSGRWYAVLGVDDVAKGFPNEFRVATIAKCGGFGPWPAYGFPYWPTPIP